MEATHSHEAARTSLWIALAVVVAGTLVVVGMSERSVVRGGPGVAAGKPALPFALAQFSTGTCCTTSPPPPTTTTTSPPPTSPPSPLVGFPGFAFGGGGSNTAPLPNEAPPPADLDDISPVHVTPNVVVPGQQIEIRGFGPWPNQSLLVVFATTPQQIGTVPTDSLGRYSGAVTVPANASPGPHQVQVSGVNPSGGSGTGVGSVQVLPASPVPAPAPTGTITPAAPPASSAAPAGAAAVARSAAARPSAGTTPLSRTGANVSFELLLSGCGFCLGGALLLLAATPRRRALVLADDSPRT